MTNEQNQNRSSCCADCESEQLLIAKGYIQEFDVAKGEISFDGDLFNQGKIIIRSSDPELSSAVIRVKRLLNEGEIVSEVPILTVYAEGTFGPGKIAATECISVESTAKDLNIIGGAFIADKVKFSCNGKLNVHVRRIDAAVYIAAADLAYGVAEGNINVVENKVTGDPIIYNTGGDVSSFPIEPSGGSDIIVVASGNVNVGSLDSAGGADTLPGRIQLYAGVKFARPAAGIVQLGCIDCVQYLNSLPPGHPLEGDGGQYNPDADVVVNGNLEGKTVSLSGRNITVNGNIYAKGHGTNTPGPTISFNAWNTITVTGTIRTNQSVQWPITGGVSIYAPSCMLQGKVTTDNFNLFYHEFSDVKTGTFETAAIEARRSIIFTAGDVEFSGGGGAIAAARNSFTDGDYNIKTGKLTAHHSISLAASGTIDTGAIELLENTDQVIGVPHYVHIHANVHKENAPQMFVGGGGAGPASIKVHGTARIFENINYGSIIITNGKSGDITINGDQIFVTNEQEGTPDFMAAAGAGRITVKGTLKVDGTSSVAAGSIALIADEIRFPDNATISANDTTTTSDRFSPRILLVTSRLNLPGNLNALCEAGKLPSITLVPKGSVPGSAEEFIGHFNGSYLIAEYININVTEEQVLVSGAGNLLLRARGDGAKTTITGTPLRLNSSGTTEIVAEGDGSQVVIDFVGAPSGQNSFVFNGGNVTVKTNNPDGEAGDITLRADRISGTAMATLAADALSDGEGGSISVSLASGNISLGNSPGAFSMTAAARQSGSGGSISISHSENTGSITLDSSFSAATLDVSALGANGTGGTITLDAGRLLNQASATDASLKADGVGTGNGGAITVKMKNDVRVSGLPGIKLSASPNGSGNGGEINVQSNGDVIIEATSVSVSGASPSTTSEGGRINVKAAEILTARGQFDADGRGAGKGGTIDFLAKEIRLRQQPKLLASGGAFGGAGGTITLFSSGSAAPMALEATDLAARGGTVGGVGGTINVQANSSISLTRNTSITADTPSSGLGDASGSVRVQANTGEISIDANSNLKGGAVNISCVGFSNQGVVEGSNVTFEAQDSNAGLAFELNNTNRIEAVKPKNAQRGALLIQTQRGILRFLGDGIFEGRTVSCDVARDIHFAGSSRFYVNDNLGVNTYGLNLLSSNVGAISIDAGDVVRVKDHTGNDANGLRCRIVAGLLTNDGVLECTDRIQMEGGHFVIDGSGELVTNVVNLLGAGGGSQGSILLRQKKIRNVSGLPSILIAANSGGGFDAVLEEGDLALGTTLTFGGDIKVKLQSGQLGSVVGASTVIRSDVGSVTLQAETGSLSLGPDLAITAANNIFLLLDANNEVAGTPHPDVGVTGTGTVFWGPQGVNVAPGSVGNLINVSAGHKVVFHDNTGGAITFKGNVTLTT